MAASTPFQILLIAVCILLSVFCGASGGIHLTGAMEDSGDYGVRQLSLDPLAEARRHQRVDVLDKKGNVDPLNNLNSDPSTPTSPITTMTKTLSNLHASTENAIPSATTKFSSSATHTSTSSDSGTLPQAFDASLGNNFTSPSCPQFFKMFLNDPSFTNCLPLSQLLLNSQSFFQAQSNSSRLTQILDSSCNVVSANCADIMATFAIQIKDRANCGVDYQAQNPVVLRAYDGFVSYSPVYQAGCLKADAKSLSSSKSDKYCFVAAIENVDEPANSYLYYLPLGISLPGSSRPTCSSCVQQTMSIFARTAQNMSNPLSSNYVPAATFIDSGCGPNFVISSIQPIQGSDSQSDAVGNQSRRWSRWLLPSVMGLILSMTW